MSEHNSDDDYPGRHTSSKEALEHVERIGTVLMTALMCFQTFLENGRTGMMHHTAQHTHLSMPIVDLAFLEDVNRRTMQECQETNFWIGENLICYSDSG